MDWKLTTVHLFHLHKYFLISSTFHPHCNYWGVVLLPCTGLETLLVWWLVMQVEGTTLLVGMLWSSAQVEWGRPYNWKVLGKYLCLPTLLLSWGIHRYVCVHSPPASAVPTVLLCAVSRKLCLTSCMLFNFFFKETRASSRNVSKVSFRIKGGIQRAFLMQDPTEKPPLHSLINWRTQHTPVHRPSMQLFIACSMNLRHAEGLVSFVICSLRISPPLELRFTLASS